MSSLRSGVLRVFLAALVMNAVPYVFVHAQTRTPADHLEAGIARLAAGDDLMALMTLNEVVSPESTADATMVAQAHAFRAQANVGLNQPERARAAALLALKADPAMVISTPQFSSAVVALFEELRRPSTMNPEATGQAAEKSSRYQDAFLAYLNAFQNLPQPPPADDDRRLRERIIEVARLLEAEPVIPPEAKAHLTKAEELLVAEKLLGGSGTASSQAAAAELRQAIRIAPWWPEATFKLAGILQKLQQLDEAVINLNLYRLADPDGYAAAIAARSDALADRAPARVATLPSASVAPVAAASATLYIYWPPRGMGGGRPKVLCDGHHVADLQGRRFIKLNVAPGGRNVGFHNKTFPFSFEAGATYYLRASAEGFPPKAMVRVISAGEGTAEMREKGVTSNDPRRTYSPDCIAGKSRR